MTDPKQYWETQIENWDSYRYGNKRNYRTLLYQLARNPESTFQYRNQILIDHLSQYITGKRVVEFGCGKGRLSKKIIDLGAESYVGYDFAINAIKNAKQENNHEKITFKNVDVVDLETIDADFVFSQGFIPCLTYEKLNHFFSITKEIDYFHINNEPLFTARRILNSLIRYTTGSYKYQGILRKVETIAPIIHQHSSNKIYVFRNEQLNSLACFSSLPFPKSLETTVI